MNKPIDCIFAFDSTGSMSTVISQVRNRIKETCNELFKEIQDLRIGIMNMGDYCDGLQVIDILSLTSNQDAIASFMNETSNTHGGDSAEAYELVLAKANLADWREDAQKVLVVIGDELPHKPGYKINWNIGSLASLACDNNKRLKLDWTTELASLAEKGAIVYGVQCLNRRSSDGFYYALANKTNGLHLTLNQFSDITALIQGICFRQANKMPQFETLIEATGRKTPQIVYLTDILAGRKPAKVPISFTTGKTEAEWNAVNPARFQVLDVPSECDIKSFVEDNGLLFRKGRGFYQLTSKSVLVQYHKECVLQDKVTGEFFNGTKVREMIGLPVGEDAKLRPTYLDKYNIFIQSTSNNRKLLRNSKFLYEVDFSR